jgi:hypothetical protein
VQSPISLRQSHISFKQSFISQIRQTIASHKTSVARDIACPRTKASTFAIEKIAKELAFPPPHLTAFVQLDSFFLPPPSKKIKTPRQHSAYSDKNNDIQGFRTDKNEYI